MDGRPGAGRRPEGLRLRNNRRPDQGTITQPNTAGGRPMKFICTFAMTPKMKSRDEAIARFKKTGGQPPKGAKLLGRWIAADFSGGTLLLEADEPKVLTE